MPVVDFHLHAYDFPVTGPASFIEFMSRQLGRPFASFVQEHSTSESYRSLLDQAGVDYGVVLAEVAPITSAVGSNETVARLCQDSPRLIPFASINPSLTANPARELERLVTEHGFRGLKLYPTYQYFYPNDALLYPLYAKAEELGIPVMWHTGSSVFPASRLKYGDPLFLDDLAVDFPELIGIITHSGRPFWYDRALALARFREHLYMEIAGLPPQRLLTYFPDLERVADKVLFASDWPSVPAIKKNIDTIRGLPLSDKAKEQVLGGNAARILKLEARESR
ncbi:MAG: amidohydrolase [Candidatus Rokubacteria bacterium]|nr:amidohydrolase [Candidatus Rokubacteria bacterium]